MQAVNYSSPYAGFRLSPLQEHVLSTFFCIHVYYLYLFFFPTGVYLSINPLAFSLPDGTIVKRRLEITWFGKQVIINTIIKIMIIMKITIILILIILLLLIIIIIKMIKIIIIITHIIIIIIMIIILILLILIILIIILL